MTPDGVLADMSSFQKGNEWGAGQRVPFEKLFWKLHTAPLVGQTKSCTFTCVATREVRKCTLARNIAIPIKMGCVSEEG